MANLQNDTDDIPTAQENYEYLDHTADVQLHAWGENLEEAIEQLVISMYGYMTTDIEKVEKLYSMDFTATGSDLTNVVFSLLESCLYNFSTEPFFIGRASRILTLKRDTGEISIDIRVWGESFDKAKHPSGTEVKAITYSNLQVNENRKIDDFSDKRRTDIYVIVDI